MKINCQHGFYTFSEIAAGELSKFVSLTGLTLERFGDGFTFSELADAPSFAIEGGTYLAAPVTKTFEGAPWEIMRENDLVYDILLGQVVPIVSVTRLFDLSFSGNVMVANGMIQAGSLTDEGERVTDYSAHLDFSDGLFYYSEVEYA